MKKTLTILLLFCTAIALGQKKKVKATDPFKGIDTAFQRVLKDRKAAGFAVAVVKNNEIIYAKGFGYRDYENKIPVTPNTLFAIGSCTKAFTASLMGLLNKDGKLDYDKPAKSYLPKLEFYNNELNDGATVRDLMCHRTGLPRHDYSWYLFTTTSRDSILQRIKYMEPTAPLREIWQYNNFGFFIQGMIAEKIFGKSWEQNVKEKLFTPLGMTASNFSIHTMEKSNDASLGYIVYKDSIIKKTDYYDINAMGPAGSINSNVNEMANWVITWINGGKFKGNEILPAAYVNQAISSQMVMSGGLPDNEIPDAYFANYGFGWMLSSYRGHYRVEHGGNIDGFSASTCFFPTDSIGIIVLSNQNGSAVPGIIRNIIADRLLGLDKIDWDGRVNDAEEKAKKTDNNVKKTAVSNQVQGTHPSHPLKAYEGLFNNPGYGTAEIKLSNDSLFMIIPERTVWLKHYHYDIFQPFNVDKKEGIDTTENNPLRLQFNMSSTGEIINMTMPLQPGLKDIEFKRIPKPKEMTKAELEKYVGEFEFAPGTTVKFYIKGEHTLYAFIQGQPEYELVPTDTNKFALKILSGYSVEFEENNKGEVISATFNQPNGKFKATKKTK